MAGASSPRAGWQKRVFAMKGAYEGRTQTFADFVGDGKLCVLANEVSMTDLPETWGGQANPKDYAISGQTQMKSVPGHTSAPVYDFGVERDFEAAAAAFERAKIGETWQIAYLWSNSEVGAAVPAADATVEVIEGIIGSNQRASSADAPAKRMLQLTHQNEYGPANA